MASFRAPRWLRAFVLTVIVTVTFAACGDDDSGEAPDGATPTTASADAGAGGLEGTVNERSRVTLDSGPLDVRVEDFAFDPTVITLPPPDGRTIVTVRLAHVGQAPHTFTIDGMIDQALAAGETHEVELDLSGGVPSDGLRFYCRLHAAQGMQGAFVAA